MKIDSRDYSGWSTPSSCIPILNNLGWRSNLFKSQRRSQWSTMEHNGAQWSTMEHNGDRNGDRNGRGYSGWSTPSSCIPNLNNLSRRLFFSRVEYQFFKVSTVVVVRFSLDGAFSWRKRRMEMFELKIPTIRSVKRKVFPSRVLAKLAPLFQSNWSGTIEGRQI